MLAQPFMACAGRPRRSLASCYGFTPRRFKRFGPMELADTISNRYIVSPDSAETAEGVQSSDCFLLDIASTALVQPVAVEAMPDSLRAAAEVFRASPDRAELMLQEDMQRTMEGVRERELQEHPQQQQQPAKEDLPELRVVVRDTAVPSGVDGALIPVRVALLDDGYWLLMAVEDEHICHGVVRTLGGCQSAESSTGGRRVIACRLAEGILSFMSWAQELQDKHCVTMRLLVPPGTTHATAVLVALAVCDPYQDTFPLDTSVLTVQDLKELNVGEQLLHTLAGGTGLRYGTAEQPASGQAGHTAFTDMVKSESPYSWRRVLVAELPTPTCRVHGAADPLCTDSVTTIMKDVEVLMKEMGRRFTLQHIVTTPCHVFLEGPLPSLLQECFTALVAQVQAGRGFSAVWQLRHICALAIKGGEADVALLRGMRLAAAVEAPVPPVAATAAAGLRVRPEVNLTPGAMRYRYPEDAAAMGPVAWQQRNLQRMQQQHL